MSRFQDDDFETYNRFLILSTYFDTDITLTGRRILQQGSRSLGRGWGCCYCPIPIHLPQLQTTGLYYCR